MNEAFNNTLKNIAEAETRYSSSTYTPPLNTIEPEVKIPQCRDTHSEYIVTWKFGRATH